MCLDIFVFVDKLKLKWSPEWVIAARLDREIGRDLRAIGYGVGFKMFRIDNVVKLRSYGWFLPKS